MSGVAIRVRGEHNKTLSEADGGFSIVFRGKKKGDPYTLQQVSKKGYELNEMDLIGRQFAFSPNVPMTPPR